MTDTVEDLKGQLIELQTQVAFQEDSIGALDSVVTRQQRQLDQLTLLCERLARQLDQISASVAGQAEDEVPPHY